ncbi:hypothetical protein L7F22_045124 [Adiantum nelumboides]|nr:hypothetical protein [Adiantum nelumboides]
MDPKRTCFGGANDREVGTSNVATNGKASMREEVPAVSRSDGARINEVDTKQKMVAKKVKPVAAPLPEGSDQIIERASKEQILRPPKRTGYKFIEKALNELKIDEDFLLENHEI